MKNTLLAGLVLTSSLLLFNHTSFSQQDSGQLFSQPFDSRSSGFMAVNTTKVPEANMYVISARVTDNTKEEVKVDARALYMASEQYVFDNLAALKRFFTIGDIYFDLDQAEIRTDAMPTLNGIVNLMTEHPAISVAITAHADSRMSQYNSKLMLRRAEAALAYLVSQGIGADRLVIEKHGRPSVANPCDNDPSCSLVVQQLNRRTEFNVVYNGINLAQIH